MLVGIYKEDEKIEYTGQVNAIQHGSMYLCKYHLTNCLNTDCFIQGEFEIEDKRIAKVIQKLNKIVNESKPQKAK
jgi:hypothetical protein